MRAVTDNDPKPAPDDEQPQATLAIRAMPDGKVHVELSAATSWISMDPEAAVFVGVQLIQEAGVLQQMASSLETVGNG